MIHVQDLSNAETKKKIDEAFKGLKGVSAATVDDNAGILGVTFDKLEPTQGTGVQPGETRAGLLVQAASRP